MHESEKQDKEDLQEFLEVYRTARRIGKWSVYLLGLALTVASLILVIKQIKQ